MTRAKMERLKLLETRAARSITEARLIGSEV